MESIICNTKQYSSVRRLIHVEQGSIKLDVLTPEITGEICSERCGSKCCNFIMSDHYVPVEMVDYGNLAKLNLTSFVTFFSSVDRPQLLNKPNGNCAFLLPDSGLCSIYEYRPLACRKYPFRNNEGEIADLPDWCELHHRASDTLKHKRIKRSKKLSKQYEELEKQLDYDVLMDYLQKDKSTKPYNLPEFIETNEILNSTNYWIISAINQDQLEEVGTILEEFIHDFKHDWTIVKLVIYNSELDPVGLIEGVHRVDRQVDIPYFDLFPPDFSEYEMLLNLITSTDDYKKHLYGGAYLPETAYDTIETRIMRSKPLNSAYQ